MESHISLVLSGGFQARLGSGASLALSNRAQALLAYLAVRPGRRHSRDKRATLLWPVDPANETAHRELMRLGRAEPGCA